MAQIAGNVAKLPAQDLNNAAWTFIGTRMLYMALYMSVKSDLLSYSRTGVYAWSIGIPLVGLWRAGQAMAAQ